MKLYDKIRSLLRVNTKLRSSDKELIWEILELEGTVIDGVITKERFMDSMSTETIRRTRQKVQENHPELQATSTVKKFRKEIQRQKGTHVYRERLVNYNDDGTVTLKGK